MRSVEAAMVFVLPIGLWEMKSVSERCKQKGFRIPLFLFEFHDN